MTSSFPVAHIDPEARPPTSGATYTLFFYGTLVHPAILSKIIQHPGASLSIQPAILPLHELHHVRGQDYPALVPLEQSEKVVAGAKAKGVGNDNAVTHLGAVRGTVVRGLAPEDVRRLDAFEGDEYVRVCVRVVPDADSPALSNEARPRDRALAEVLSKLDEAKVKAMLKEAAAAEGQVEERTEAAQAYRWRAPLEELEPKIWSFAEFASSARTARWI